LAAEEFNSRPLSKKKKEIPVNTNREDIRNVGCKDQKAPADAIVVVNPQGIAVDSNNAFARLCGVPAGLIVGRPLELFAPELARELEVLAEAADDRLVRTPGGDFGLDIQPFAGNQQSAADRIVKLRSTSMSEVA